MADRILITEVDFKRLTRLINDQRAGAYPDTESLDRLVHELDRAEVVEGDAVPLDLVTMNSEVWLKDLESDDIRLCRLIFPNQARTANSLSILAPLGTAILGCRECDLIEWRAPTGVRRLQIVKVLSQPEAANVRGA